MELAIDPLVPRTRCERERSPIPWNITIKAVCPFQCSDQTIIAAVVAIVAEWDAQPAMPSTAATLAMTS
jgi:hypothetical protein